MQTLRGSAHGATAPVCSTSGRPAATPISHVAYERLQRRLTQFTASTRSLTSPFLRRSLVVSASRSPPKEPWWEKNNPPNMKAVNSVQQFVDELASAGDRLVVVDFYAKWCNACRSLFPKLCQMGNDNLDIIILKVDFDENRDIAKPLAIKVLPYFHFYRGAEGRVAAFSASVSKIQRLRDALELHNSPRCQFEKFDGVEEFPGITPHFFENNVVMHGLPQSADSAFEMPEQGMREEREPAPV